VAAPDAVDVLKALDRARYRSLPLSGLDEADVRHLLRDVAGKEHSPGRVRAVHRQTEGNPFFVLEIATWGMHADSATPESDDVSIPESVRTVIRRRLQHLSGAAHRALRIAAAIGHEFDFATLTAIYDPRHEDELYVALGEALDAHVVQRAGAHDGYRFRHALIWQTLYEELSPSYRVRAHARIAAALLAGYGAAADDHAAELAWHFERARRMLGTNELLRYSRLAGEQALAAHAYEEAVAHLDRALDARGVTAMDDDAAAINVALGYARAALSPRWARQDAWDNLRRAAEHYIAAGDLARAVAAVAHPCIPPESAIDIAEVVGGVLERVAPDSWEAGCLRARYAAAVFFETGDHSRARRLFAAALATASSLGDAALELRTLSLATSVDHFAIDWSGVLIQSRRTLTLARRIDEAHSEIYARYRMSFALAFSGRATTARREARVNLARAEQLRDRGLLEDGLYVNGALALLTGDWDAARQLTERGLDLSPANLPLLHMRALLEIELGEHDAAARSVSTLLEASSGVGPYPLAQAYGHLLLSQIGYLTDRPPDLPLPPPLGPSAIPLTNALAAIAHGLTAVLRDDAEAALTATRELEPMRGLILAPTAVTDRLLGLFAHTGGRYDDAADHFEHAIAFAQSAGYTPEIGWSCHDFAALLLQRGARGDRDRAHALLDEAHAIARDFSMHALALRAAALHERAAAIHAPRAEALTDRECEVLRLVALGKSNKAIARELAISTNTVAVHVARILAKTGCRNRTEVARYAPRVWIARDEPTAGSR
jgi:DNA-binding CsgD family transcriptional regulator